jgi:hypothetical protein
MTKRRSHHALMVPTTQAFETFRTGASKRN